MDNSHDADMGKDFRGAAGKVLLGLERIGGQRWTETRWMEESWPEPSAWLWSLHIVRADGLTMVIVCDANKGKVFCLPDKMQRPLLDGSCEEKTIAAFASYRDGRGRIPDVWGSAVPISRFIALPESAAEEFHKMAIEECSELYPLAQRGLAEVKAGVEKAREVVLGITRRYEAWREVSAEHIVLHFENGLPSVQVGFGGIARVGRLLFDGPDISPESVMGVLEAATKALK